MSKKYVRYFFGFIDTQQDWINSMSEKGYRLVKTGKLIFEFEKCEPNKYQYYIEFVAHKSNSELKAYKQFLEEIGYTVMTKNLNLNWSMGKIRFRPYGEGKGKIATSPGNYNKELLIVEKLNDGKYFELHTSAEDKLCYYKPQRNAYLSLILLCLFLFMWKWLSTTELTTSTFLFLMFGILAIFPVICYQNQINTIKKHMKISE
ncbi:MAG: DUF2812 domain-containing protein [Turicibacter sp.]